MRIRTLIPALFAALAIACTATKQAPLATNSNAALRPTTPEERIQDFDQLLALFKTYYGPYEFKERRLGISIEKTITDLRDKAVNAKTDEEFAGYVMQVGAAMKDGHVQIRILNTSSGIMRYYLPIVLTPLEGHAIVGDIDAALSKAIGVENGDEVTLIDGKGPYEILKTALKYRATARPESEQHFLVYALQRPSYMTELIPTKQLVQLAVKKVNGDEKVVDVPWLTKSYNDDAKVLLPNSRLNLKVPFADDLNAHATYKQMGSTQPFFLTPQTQEAYKFVTVYPSDASRKKFGLADAEKPPIYAALYRYGGKTILLMRNSGYAPSDYKSPIYIKAYQALMYEFEALADVMVLDQTHNGGGSYCAEFYNLFARPGDRQSAQLLNADRKWINDLLVGWQEEEPELVGTWDAKTAEAWSLMVEKAFDAGQTLTEPIPLFSGGFYTAKRDYTWTKPMLVLIDELAGSCADMFPMLVKANKRAQLFGQPTMGLGGNVEEVGTLNNSRIPVRMTRGLFYTYMPDRLPTDLEVVENNAVTPDIPYQHTIKDFRGGYTDYVKAFSEQAIRQ